MIGKAPRGFQAALIYLAALILLVISCGPILWMLSQSLKNMNEIILKPYDAVPRQVTLAAFGDALHGGTYENVRLARDFINTIFYAGGSTITNVVLGITAGYAFARLRFPLRKFLFGLVIVAMVVPTAAIIIPVFMIVRTVSFGSGPLGWINTYQGLILPSAVTGFTIVLARQFLRGIPRELDESALIDGCGPLTILWFVILPLSGPAIASVATLNFLTRWDDYLWPSVAGVSPDMFTLQVGLRFLEASYAQQWPLLMASCVLAALPIILLYIVLQPMFDRGLASFGTGWEV
jgi:multiple sugar transport system permease protein